MSSGNWKGAGGNKPPSSGGGSKSRRPWQPGDPTKKPTVGRKKSRLGRFILAGVAVGILTAAIVIIAKWLTPPVYPTYIVVAPSPGKTLAGPENAAGSMAATSLAEWLSKQSSEKRVHLAANPTQTADRDAWKGVFDKQKDAPAIVLYFTAIGGADENGAFLWFVPPEAAVPSNDHKLYVADILKHFKDKHNNSTPKLIVFDAARAPASWPHGILANDFARALKELDKQIESIDGLAVINSSDEGERAWNSEGMRSSVFGHFFQEGLRGAVGERGKALQGGVFFDYLKRSVMNWADGNRNDKQTPILLPSTSGRSRIESMSVAYTPTSDYVAPKLDHAAWTTPDDLKQAWDTAEQFASRASGPSPDTWTPANWRKYLDLLIRWEHLVRQGEDPGPFRDEARLLAQKLILVSGADEPCASVAIPAGPALGIAIGAIADDDFRKWWSPIKGITRAAAWSERGGDPLSLTQSRVAVAERVIDRVVKLKPSTLVREGETALSAADDLLDAVDRGDPGTAEGHFIRMLHKDLLASPRPDDELLATAIEVRRQAERAAWIGGADATRYPYAEQVSRWIHEQVDAGDRDRRTAEDRLFGVEPAQWQLAQSGFTTARQHYLAAEADAAIVAQALTIRDRVLARLPYYARWLAAYRSESTKLPEREVNALIERAIAAARGAHEINRLSAEPPSGNSERKARIAELKRQADAVNTDFNAVIDAFNTEVKSLSGNVLQSNWYAIDNALSVPFIPTTRRTELLNHLRNIGRELEVGKGNRDAVSKDSRTDYLLQAGQRHGQLAAAILDIPVPDLKGWPELRTTGSTIGTRFQTRSGEIQQHLTAANNPAKPFNESSPPLTAAAFAARLVDPAAELPMMDAVDAERRFRQYEFLIWQANRIMDDGWADVTTTTIARKWYCTRAAKLVLDAAQSRVGLSDSMPASERERRLAAIEAVRKREPMELTLTGPASRAICDEPSWSYEFTISRKPQDKVGNPIYWITGPTANFGIADQDKLQRKLITQLETQTTYTTERVTFTNPAAPEKKVAPEQIVGNALYRGQRYETPTALRSGGKPIRDIAYDPPRGDAGFCVIANPEDVAGAVTILIDLSGSMTYDNAGNMNVPYDRTRLKETFDAIEPVLRALPRGAILTVAVFWGGNRPFVEPRIQKRKLTGDQQDRDEIVKLVRNITVVDKQASTPLAQSIETVVSRTDGSRYWPEPHQHSGVRTLIVLTDGADNWNSQQAINEGRAKKLAGQVVQDALLDDDAQPDTALYLMFFALDATDTRESQSQFAVLENPEPFRRKKRTPPVMLTKSKAGELTPIINQVLRPRVKYTNNQFAAANRQGELFFTLPDEGFNQISPALPQGTYEFLNLRMPQTLRLDPGDRIILRTRSSPQDRRVDLVLPPHVYDSTDPKGPRARNTNVCATIPSANVKNEVDWWRLSATVTLERPIPEQGTDPALRRYRPLITWFDFHPNGAPRPMPIAIRNRPHLVAPAWNIECSEWSSGRNLLNTVERPKLACYWVENPTPNGTIAIKLRSPHTALNKDNESRPMDGRTVKIVSITREKGGSEGLSPDRDYLVVRLEYERSELPVFVRPNGFKPDNNQFQLVQRHRYYDLEPNQPGGPRVGRYTARFGPIDEKDEDLEITLDIISVTDLKREAMGNGRDVTVDFGASQPWSPGNALTKYSFEPRKDN